MKTIKFSSTVLFFIFSLFSISAPVQADLNSGANCKAANLQQALALGMGHSQFGATNNGSGPFFALCPFSQDTYIGVTLVRIGIGMDFPAGGGNVTCIFRAQSTIANTFVTQMIPINSVSTFGAIETDLIPNISIQNNPNLTIVCPLSPGQTIRWYYART